MTVVNDSDEPAFCTDVTEVLMIIKEEDTKSKISKIECNDSD